MKRDFTAWHELKTVIEATGRPVLFREREVWWCSLGANIGSEEDGKNQLFERPVLVIRKFNGDTLWVLPLTSRKKTGKFYQSFGLRQTESTAILSQIRTLSAKRLIRRVGKLSNQQFALVEAAFQHLIKETDPARGPRVPNGNLYTHSTSVNAVRQDAS